MLPKTPPVSLCMAPWTHTYVSPQTERRMCCASREPAQNFQQYIDTTMGSGSYHPITLEQHWNGEHMRSVRRRMMSGEVLPECEVCDNKLLNTDVYRTYFWHLFGDKYYEKIWHTTDDTGYTTMQPVSWDYRFSNLCNFKCRMCGDMLSSAWESEQRQHNMIDWSNPKNNWMRPDVRRDIARFQDNEIEKEFAEAVEQHRIEEIYWVGGEPLMYKQHWQYMQRIIELGDGGSLYARYNTNLSRIEYQGCHLFDDILCHVRDWQICASIDGTGSIGEYIRTGLSWPLFLENFRRGLKSRKHPRQMRFDFTLTLPGLFEAVKLQQLADELDVEVLAKVVFSFTPDIIMSPLSLPRHILDRKISEIYPQTHGAMAAVFDQLRQRPTFQEQWPDEYDDAMIRGKARISRLENIRGDTFTMADILKQDREIYEWWQDIR
jgi:hypothetical protein